MTDLVVKPPPGRGVYCNRTLNLRSIRVIGYDMDYTLVHYHVEDWERRAYSHIKGRLADAGWPVKDFEFDPELVIRGLVIDTELGNILKCNRFGFIKTAYHGSRRMALEELRETYLRTNIDLGDSRYRFLNTLFVLSEGCIYAQLVDRLDDGGLRDVVKGYEDLHRMLRRYVDATHMEGQLKAEIIADPGRYVELDEEAALALLDQRHAGKRLLLITNSGWRYTSAMMTHAFDRFLPGDMTWRELFEVTVVAARKPSFFSGSASLLEVVNEDGLLKPHMGELGTGRCYYGGNAALLERQLGVSGDEILYLGDHVYGDVHVSKSVLRWRTGFILRELEGELAAVERDADGLEMLAELMTQKEALEYRQCQLRLAQQRKKLSYGPAVGRGGDLPRLLGKLRGQLAALDDRIGPLAAKAGEAHNARWGLLMRAGNDKSQLAYQIERFADIYTSRVANLMFTTPFAYLRSRRGTLPHDPL